MINISLCADRNDFVFICLRKNRLLKRKYGRILENCFLYGKNICPAAADFVSFVIPKTRGGNRSVKRLFYFCKNLSTQIKKADSSGGASAGHRPRAVGKESAIFLNPKTRGGLS